MNSKQANELLQRYLNGQATPREVKLIDQWYKHLSDQGEWKWGEGEKLSLQSAIEKGLLKGIEEGVTKPSYFPRLTFLHRMRWIAAAAVVLLFGSGAYVLLFHKPAKATTLSQKLRFKNDIAPGKNAAILTLSGGQKILLDSSSLGTIRNQGSATILSANGKLSYSSGALHEQPSQILFNTLSTPRGNQYQLLLPDGSHVWLNAASSITYPTAFVGKERRVIITGEAYFEIAKNPKLPFIVQNKDMSIQVFGTHFNVKAYDDEEATKTTLIEGSVRILRAGKTSMLVPGQQAILPNTNKRMQVINDANIDEVTAWKNGEFKFSDATIETIMLQMARWYDVDVEYTAKISQHFIAELPRNIPVSESLKLLELTGQVHFRIEGRKIIVIP